MKRQLAVVITLCGFASFFHSCAKPSANSAASSAPATPFPEVPNDGSTSNDGSATATGSGTGTGTSSGTGSGSGTDNGSCASETAGVKLSGTVAITGLSLTGIQPTQVVALSIDGAGAPVSNTSMPLDTKGAFSSAADCGALHLTDDGSNHYGSGSDMHGDQGRAAGLMLLAAGPDALDDTKTPRQKLMAFGNGTIGLPQDNSGDSSRSLVALPLDGTTAASALDLGTISQDANGNAVSTLTVSQGAKALGGNDDTFREIANVNKPARNAQNVLANTNGTSNVS